MTREQLIASLAAADNADVLYLDDDRYLDWSTTNDTGVTLEVGDGTDAIQLDMTRDEIAALQQRLTLWLLADAA